MSSPDIGLFSIDDYRGHLFDQIRGAYFVDLLIEQHFKFNDRPNHFCCLYMPARDDIRIAACDSQHGFSHIRLICQSFRVDIVHAVCQPLYRPPRFFYFCFSFTLGKRFLHLICGKLAFAASARA